MGSASADGMIMVRAARQAAAAMTGIFYARWCSLLCRGTWDRCPGRRRWWGQTGPMPTSCWEPAGRWPGADNSRPPFVGWLAYDEGVGLVS